MEIVASRLLARPILQEYDAFTVDELAVNPASVQRVEVAAWRESESLHNERDLKWIQQAARLLARPILQKYDAFHSCSARPLHPAEFGKLFAVW